MAPMSEWINNAQLIPEGQPYKVDSACRVVVPAHLRAKFKIGVGDHMDYYTTFVDNKWFICMTKHIEEEPEVEVQEEAVSENE
jgi:bifunctional DNA-binding transcriptional regulator/antitoxin component of YhaV-PrlF toxin-antitoxin module